MFSFPRFSVFFSLLHMNVDTTNTLYIFLYKIVTSSETLAWSVVAAIVRVLLAIFKRKLFCKDWMSWCVCVCVRRQDTKLQIVNSTIHNRTGNRNFLKMFITQSDNDITYTDGFLFLFFSKKNVFILLVSR